MIQDKYKTTHAAISFSALETMQKMVQQLQEERDALLKSAKIAFSALNVSVPIDDKSVLQYNSHVAAIKSLDKVIAACQDSKKVMQ